MRLGRLAAAGLIAGAMVAFAAALLMPRRRPQFEMEPGAPGPAEPRAARHVDLTVAEPVDTSPTRSGTSG